VTQEEKAPWRVNDKVHTLSIIDHKVPWRDGQPVFMCLDGTNDWFLPLFSDIDRLETMAAAINLPYDGVKNIDSQSEFLDSIPYRMEGRRIRIMIDPYQTERGTTRYKELIRDTRC
jgi:hypothetical protein